MELQIKDNFRPNFGIGTLLFYDNENVIKEKIGYPDLKNTDNNESEDYTINLSYKSFGLECFVHYEDSKFSYTSFHLRKLIIDNVNLQNMGENDSLVFLEKYHSNHSIEYLVDVKEDVEENIYFFEKIGLTLWFSKNELSDICVEPIWE